MRDLLVSSVVILLLLRMMRDARIGAYLWAWLSLMNPHKLTWGFAYSMPFAMATAIATLVMLPFSKHRRPLPMNGGVVMMLMLWGWMTLTSVAAITSPDQVWERWIFVSKIYLMTLVTLMLLRGKDSIHTLLWVVVCSIGYFGFKGGAFTILTGGSYRVWGPPESMLEDNNAFAVACLIILPFVYYLQQTVVRRWLRWLLLLAMVLIGASALGSQSRGALVGLFAMAVVLGLKSKHPFRFTLGLAVLLAVGVAFMPDSWTQRMDTIQNYSEDNSALSRLYTWRTLLNVAIDRPLVGAGFRADSLRIFEAYAPVGPEYNVFQGKVWVAHSIYFQALGEHGFPGLMLFLGIWLWTWRAAGRVAKDAEKDPELATWMPLLMRMCQTSLVAYGAGGAFLSLMLLDLPYYILAFVTLCRCELDERQRLAKAAPAGAGAAGASSVAPAQPALVAGLAASPVGLDASSLGRPTAHP